MKHILGLYLLLFFVFSCAEKPAATIDGELKQWHRITLTFDGPMTSEMDEDNPFLNYRLDVTFSNDGKDFVVPGFYAADGKAAETSSTEGNKWQVRFAPNTIGEWTYVVSFKKGNDVAVADDVAAAKSGGSIDGLKGSFTISASDKTGIDNRAKGRLNYVGESYLKFAGNDEYFIKLGVDAPENLLAYADFDATPNVGDRLKNWQPHNKDYTHAGDTFLWQKGKGKNLLGAINYLASEGLNSFSFLTFNVDGDDRNVFPYLLNTSEENYKAYADSHENINAWETMFDKTRLDVSKLEQWERILDYAETQGMFLHFKTNETETDHLMDKGVFGVEGKLYYRELIARFGHHLSMNWNLGEENDQPTVEVLKVANYITKLDAYKHHLVIHTFPNKDDRYQDFIGDQSPLTGASLQLRDPIFLDVHTRVLKWKTKSDSTGRKWALSVDEPGKADIALLPDAEDSTHHEARSNALWGTLMAGGYGVEWFFGYASPHSDLTCEDFRSRDLFWDQNRHAMKFFKRDIPFWEMLPADALTSDTLSYCFAKKDKVYAVYLPMALQTTSLDLGNTGKEYLISWYDPRNGGERVDGSVKSVLATGSVSLGYPPNNKEKDWVALIMVKE